MKCGIPCTFFIIYYLNNEVNCYWQDVKSLFVVSVCRHQAGWFPFNLENELQLPGDRANQDDMEGELQNLDLQEMVAAFTKNITQG